MELQSKTAVSAIGTAAPRRSLWRIRIADYVELTKPGVIWLILMSTGAGFYIGAQGAVDLLLLFHAVLGTALVAGGTGTLNQYLEREGDARMRRTEKRPLPARRMEPRTALVFGISLSTLGMLQLALAVNLLASFLALGTLASYLLLYTPLKKRTVYCTLVGALPGAMPPVIGWAAARAEIGLEAVVLFAILFLWQFPHFLAIAWMYRDDYARGGIVMLPVIDRDGKSTGRQINFCAWLLLPVSLLPAFMGMAGPVYLFGCLALGLAFIYYAASADLSRSLRGARRLLLASVVYLPLLLALMVVDKVKL
ncbi:MAG: heme o synthase [Acidobacteriota bacterium]